MAIMILIFIDETSDSKFKDYFGLCCAVINSSSYVQVKQQFQGILVKDGWDPSIEFKGSFLFSASSGDTSIPVDKRVEIAHKLLDLNVAKKNARISFHYFRKQSDNHKADYLEFLPTLIEKALPKVDHKNGKDIVAVYCDHRSDITTSEIRAAIKPVLGKKEYTLQEDVVMPVSGFETVGILYADLIGYLAARVDTISNDSELFENIPKSEWQKNGKVRKLLSSTELLDKIKKLQLYHLKETRKR